MPLRIALRLFLAAAAIAVTTTLTSAQEAASPAQPHVRGATAETVLLLNELIARSATVRDLIERLDRTDVIVYVRYAWFPTTGLRGRTGLVATGDHRRLLLIEISGRHNRTDQLVVLGHELQHAMEIAGTPSVTDVRSLAELYASIGELTSYSEALETYETAAAAETGRRVRGELMAPAVLTDAAGVRN